MRGTESEAEREIPQTLAAAKAEGKEIPGPPNSRFEPLPEPTLRTGVQSTTTTAIALLQK